MRCLRLVLVVTACTTTHKSATPDAAATDVTVREQDFGCIETMTQVGDLRVANLASATADTVAAATNGSRFPVGSLVQMTPDEAMVKHAPGFDAATDDWEFFFLALSSSGATILSRGGTNVSAIVNGQPFGETCVACHSTAPTRWDFICARGTDHACKTLPNDTSAAIAQAQAADPRCGQ